MNSDSSTAGGDKKHYLVSGGSGGIGAAVCDGFARRGVIPVVGYYSNAASAEEVARRCGGFALHLDLASDESIDVAIERLVRPDIRLAGVVLAGSPPLALCPFTRISDEEMTAQFRVNVFGPQRLLAGLVRSCFRKTRDGAVVGVLTKAMGGEGEPAMPGLGAYVMAKYGLAGVLEVLRASHGWLHVYAVSPGFTDTPMLDSFDERFLQMMREKEPFQTPEEVARIIVEQVLGPAGKTVG